MFTGSLITIPTASRREASWATPSTVRTGSAGRSCAVSCRRRF